MSVAFSACVERSRFLPKLNLNATANTRCLRTHQVGDLDFEIQLPAVAAQTELPSQPSTRRTPANRGRPRPSSGRTAQKQPTQSPPPPVASHSSNNANISVKRRMLDLSGEMISAFPPSSASRSTRSRGREDLHALEEDPLAADGEPLEQASAIQPSLEPDELEGKQDSARQIPPPKSKRRRTAKVQEFDEITESPRDAPGSGQKRRGVPQEVQTSVPNRQGPLPDVTPTVPRRNKRTAGEVLHTRPSPELSRRRSPRVSQGRSPLEELDELSPEQIVRPHREQQFSDVEGEEQQGAKAIDDLEAAKRLRKARKRKASEVVPEENERVSQEPDLDEVVQRETKKARKAIRSPTKQRQGKKKSNPDEDVSQSRSKGSIPVVVHRLTNPIVYGEDDTEIDVLNPEVGHIKRGGVNAVDVLSQVCEELIGSALDMLDESGSRAETAAVRREVKTKMSAVEGFQEVLRMSLFELVCLALLQDL
jgi:hypothetical protein